MEWKLRSDLKTLAKFVSVYCRHQHQGVSKAPRELWRPDLPALAGETVELCPECRKLLVYACVKRSRCPQDPKPACKRCSSPCFPARHRDAMRDVMRYSGRKLVLSGRLDYVWRLFF